MKLLFVLVLVLLAALIQRQSDKRCLQALEASLQLSRSQVEPGEEFTLILTLRNRGRWILPFLRYWIPVPEELEPHVDSRYLHSKQGHFLDVQQRFLSGTAWLFPRQSLTIHFPAALEKRGYYTFHTLTVSGGDFLGLSERPRSFDAFRDIVVYPQAAPRQEISQVLGGLMGEISVRRFIQEDPVLTLGFREYTGKEPMKAISWTQSARRNQLMVKNFDYTVDPSASVIVNVDGNGPDLPARLEQCFRLARSVCQELEARHVNYDFRSNAVTTGSRRASDYFPRGLGYGHYSGILEYLGRATYEARHSGRQMVQAMASDGSFGHGILFITPWETSPAVDAVRRYATQSGSSLRILTPKEETQW